MFSVCFKEMPKVPGMSKCFSACRLMSDYAFQLSWISFCNP